MSMHWTEDQLREVMARKDRRNIPQERKAEIASMGGKARQRKYGNTPVEVDGHKFPSKKQADYYLQLQLMKAGGAIRGFACEVTIPLPSGKRSLRIDFMVVNIDLSIRWIDTKGMVTKDWAVKRDELQHSLGITIETV